MLKQIIRSIPNFITLLNLFSGSVAIILILEHRPVFAAYFIGIALLLDFLDGFLARLLNARSNIGAQLDSLADIVSFGVAPGILIYEMLGIAIDQSMNNYSYLIPFIALIIPIFSAIRLARFNIDKEQESEFRGLPTPATAIFIASFPLIIHYQPDTNFIIQIIHSPIFLILISFLLSILMVSRIPLISLKFKNTLWKENWYRYILILISIILILNFQFIAFGLIIIIYIIISLFKNRFAK